MKFYIDTYIYLNLWQNEGNYGNLAKDFFEKYNESIFYYSGFLLKELSFILDKEDYYQKIKKFHFSSNFKKLQVYSKDFSEAKRIEMEINYKIWFFDIIHLLLAKKVNAILVTRDRDLLDVAKIYSILAKKPEEL